MKKITKPNDYKFIDNALTNDKTYFDYLNRMKTIMLSRFEWVNLPDSMNERYLEKCLYYFGRASFIDTEEYGILNTQTNSNGYLNIYGLPTKLHNRTYNGITFDRKLYQTLSDNPEKQRKEECILVLNDKEGLPTAYTIELFAYRLYLAERTIDTNISAQRTPVLLLCNDKQRLTMENLYSQYDGNKPFIFADKNNGIDLDSIKSIKTEAPYIVDKVSEYKKDIWNEFLTFAGVNNLQTEKAERLISDEANQNNEVINLFLQNYLTPRKLACKQFNDLFGLTGTDKEISVRVRSDLHNVIKNTESVVGDYINDEFKDDIKNEINDGSDIDG